MRLWLNSRLVEVEVLSVHWWGKGAYRLKRSTPKARYHVYGESQGNHTDEELWDICTVVRVVVRKLEPTEEVDAEQTEDDNPKAEEYLAVEYVPTVGKIGHGEELQGEGKFDEAEDHFYHVHPAA